MQMTRIEHKPRGSRTNGSLAGLNRGVKAYRTATLHARFCWGKGPLCSGTLVFSQTMVYKNVRVYRSLALPGWAYPRRTLRSKPAGRIHASPNGPRYVLAPNGIPTLDRIL